MPQSLLDTKFKGVDNRNFLRVHTTTRAWTGTWTRLWDLGRCRATFATMMAGSEAGEPIIVQIMRRGEERARERKREERVVAALAATTPTAPSTPPGYRAATPFEEPAGAAALPRIRFRGPDDTDGREEEGAKSDDDAEGEDEGGDMSDAALQAALLADVAVAATAAAANASGRVLAEEGTEKAEVGVMVREVEEGEVAADAEAAGEGEGRDEGEEETDDDDTVSDTSYCEDIQEELEMGALRAELLSGGNSLARIFELLDPAWSYRELRARMELREIASVMEDIRRALS